ncbi:hypothetical protein CEP52_006932 [Fusarium oligoseptatum]|uniref:Uncharacterized protein n=1 Tax=Fusarium oligoseptatum TaxID=2604345 RepID=A0A428TQI3_9HYPO|nr:hypothetical protein CEP52_006932 [Fusarium oligoseptatum]
MLFTLILIFPAATLASWLPIRPRQASSSDDCTITSTLPPVTMTSIYPVSTIAGSGQGQVTGGGSLIYTTALPTLGPSGPGLHTYTVTAPCPSAECQPPAASECPPGFTTAAVVCHGPSSPDALDRPQDAAGAADIPEHQPIPGSPNSPSAPPSAGSESPPSSPETVQEPATGVEKPATVGNPDAGSPETHASSNASSSSDSESSAPGTIEKPTTAEKPNAGSAGTPKEPEAHASPNTPGSSDSEAEASSSSPSGTVEKPVTAENPDTGSPDTSKNPEGHASPKIPASSDSGSAGSSSSPSTLPDSSATDQRPENPDLPESPKSPTSPTAPDSQNPATNPHDSTVPHDGTVGEDTVPEVVSSPHATPVIVTGSAPGSKVSKATILGPLIISFLVCLPLYIH